MRSPTALLVALIAIILFAALLTDFAVALWDRFNAAMQSAVRNITAIGGVVATYTEPAINPRWGADQLYPILMFVIWILLLALIALIAEALRERRGGGDEE
jgi:ABC-type cobalt transport system substrate-binding protein